MSTPLKNTKPALHLKYQDHNNFFANNIPGKLIEFQLIATLISLQNKKGEKVQKKTDYLRVVVKLARKFLSETINIVRLYCI